MKTILILLIGLCLAGCQGKSSTLTVMVPSGIPLIAVGSFLNDEEIAITDVNNPSLLISAMTSQSHDIVIAPLNVGVKAYNTNNQSYQLAGILTFGNSYIVTRKSHSLSSITDLQGQTLLAYGQNSTPDIVLKTSLQTNDVTAFIGYQANINLTVPLFLCNTNDVNDESCSEYSYLLAAEPIISLFEEKYQLPLNILDLQAVLSTQIEKIPQAAIFVNPYSSNQPAIDLFLNNLFENTKELNENPQDYAQSIFHNHPYFESLTLQVLEKCIPRSQIAFEKVSAQTEYLLNYYQLVLTFDSQIFGGKLPDAGFYR